MRITAILAFVFLSISTFAQGPCAYKKSLSLSGSSSLSAADFESMQNYDVKYYKLDLNVENNSVKLSGNVSMQAKSLTNLKSIILQLHQSMIVDSIWINGSKTTFSRATDILTIISIDTIKPGELFSVTTWYRGTPNQSATAALGTSVTNNSAHSVTWSNSQPFSSYEWWPCKQVLSDKADSLEVWVTTDTINKVGSNGLLKKITPLPKGKHRYEWKSNYPIAYYLISFAVCPYEEFNLYAHPLGSDSILIQNYIYKNSDPEVKSSLKLTPYIIEYYSNILGLYPFAKEKYGHCQSEINGGMEHQTMSTMGEFFFDINAHELAHQWFGNMVTCGTWSDIWLNEGFASYCELLAFEQFLPSGVNEKIDEIMDYAKFSSGTLSVKDTFNVPVIFDYFSTYKKGAALLRSLRYEINNDSIFFAGFQKYLKDHSYSVARSIDFKSTMATVSGKNLDQFFNQWLYSPGYPVFEGKWNQVNDDVLLNINQFASDGNTIFKTPIDILLKSFNGDTTIRIFIDAKSNNLKIKTNGKKIYSIRMDPKKFILNEVTSLTQDKNYVSFVKNFREQNILIFPNPAKDVLFIQNADGLSLDIINSVGEKIITHHVIEESQNIDVSILKPGVYFVKLSHDGTAFYQKFIKE